MHILFHRPTPWSSSVQCSTKTFAQVAAAEGNQVSYLQSTINLAHRIAGKGYYSVWKEGSRHVDPNIWVTSSCALVPDVSRFGLFSNSLAAANYRSCIPSIRKQVSCSGFGPPDVIWTTVPGSSALKSIFPKAKFVFHVIDYYPAFRGDRIMAFEKNDYDRADHIFTIGHTLKDYLVDGLAINREKITVLGQGVNLSRYEKKLIEPVDLADLPSPRAIWVGVINKADRKLMAQVAADMNRIGGCTVLIGPSGSWEQELVNENPGSVFWLGPKLSSDVPAYLLNSQVGLMLYDREKQDVYRGQNPLKLYEYLAAGLPVLSTPHDEYRFLKPPVSEISEDSQIRPAIEEALNTPSRKTENQKFVANCSWQSLWHEAQRTIEQEIPNR